MFLSLKMATSSYLIDRAGVPSRTKRRSPNVRLPANVGMLHYKQYNRVR